MQMYVFKILRGNIIVNLDLKALSVTPVKNIYLICFN